MAHTNAWSESVPVGTENAATCDDYLRQWRLDLGERLEDMFYGFNAGSNADQENDYGVKKFRMITQSSNPATVPSSGSAYYSHIYTKAISGVPELFYQDDANTTLQLTSGGNLKSTAGLVVDGTSTLTGAVSCAATLDVAGNIDPTSYETTNGGFLDEDAMTSNSATAVASQQSIKAYVDSNPSWTTYEGGESVTFPGGLIFKCGYQAYDLQDSEVEFATPFPTGIVSANVVAKESTASASNTWCFIIATSTSKIDFWYSLTSIEGVYWQAWGY